MKLPHRTALIFWSAVLFSLTGFLFIGLSKLLAFSLLLLSSLYNVWCLRRNDRDGFVKAKEMRRAHEPPRRFGAGQVFSLLVLLIGQVGTATYVLMASPAVQ